MCGLSLAAKTSREGPKPRSYLPKKAPNCWEDLANKNRHHSTPGSHASTSVALTLLLPITHLSALANTCLGTCLQKQNCMHAVSNKQTLPMAGDLAQPFHCMHITACFVCSRQRLQLHNRTVRKQRFAPHRTAVLDSYTVPDHASSGSKTPSAPIPRPTSHHASRAFQQWRPAFVHALTRTRINSYTLNLPEFKNGKQVRELLERIAMTMRLASGTS